MLAEFQKISTDEWFVLTVVAAALLLGFLFGFLAFKYWQADVCKSPIKVSDSQVE